MVFISSENKAITTTPHTASPLVIFFLDDSIKWYEALILFLWYFCYVIFMKFNVMFEGKFLEVRLLNYTKGGDPFYNTLKCHPLRDANGKLTHYCGVLEGEPVPEGQVPKRTTQPPDTLTIGLPPAAARAPPRAAPPLLLLLSAAARAGLRSPLSRKKQMATAMIAIKTGFMSDIG